MLIEHPEIDNTQTMIVNFTSFGKSSLDFFIYTFTNTTQWIKYHEVKQDVLLKIINIVEGHGAEFAFPTSTVHFADNEGDIESKSAVSNVMRKGLGNQKFGEEAGGE